MAQCGVTRLTPPSLASQKGSLHNNLQRRRKLLSTVECKALARQSPNPRDQRSRVQLTVVLSFKFCRVYRYDGPCMRSRCQSCHHGLIDGEVEAAELPSGVRSARDSVEGKPVGLAGR